ncbi:MAG: methanogenesis marker 6 protein [ANME-2 cluster archaeon]|nr:methanogenesis marker 6 protein [ANME-2 cluster archaeon]MDF1556999.1 methanogenesis marker 6 protein [ANME-2 cluster archaeon]
MSDDDIIIKMIVLHSTFTLPSDIVIKVYESKADIMVKETCFGLIIEGKRSEVDRVVTEIRKLDPNRIFIKERGVPPGDEYRCRAGRGGGPKPGFHQHELEFALLPYFTEALDEIERGEMPEQKDTTPPRLTINKLKEIIEEEVKQSERGY